MIFVCGVSASGKSSLVRAFTVTNPKFNHVKGSELLQNAGYPIRNLDAGAAEQNQLALLAILHSKKLVAPETIFDGHITIETDGAPYIVPSWFLRKASVNGIICVLNDILTIELRRSQRADGLSADIDALQKEEQRSAKAHARELGIRYVQVDANNQNSFSAAVSEVSGGRSFH